MTTELRGVIPITATPFDDSGQVDEASIATLVEFEARCGVHGLNVLGIMGEAHKLSEGERRRVAEVFVKSAAGRFPVVVGTSHGGTAVVTELSQAAEAAGAAAVMVAPPIGLRGEAVILAHYRAVARAIAIPVVVQDEPVTTGVLMSPELLVRIATEVPACRYIKLEEAPTPTKITAMRRLPGGDGVRIFGGQNAMYFYEELSRGAVGIMTGVGGAGHPGPDLHRLHRGRPRGCGGDLRPLRLLHPVRGPAGHRPRAPEGAPASPRRHRQQRRAPARADAGRRHAEGARRHPRAPRDPLASASLKGPLAPPATGGAPPGRN